MAITVTLAEQKMTDGTTKLKLVTPYTPSLPAKCKALGGKWSAASKAWYFDLRDASRIRNLCVEAFGVDPLAEPDEQPELVTVRWYLEPIAYPPTEDAVARAREQRLGDEAWMFGREILQRPGRDSAVRLGDGVAIIRGGFAGSGGSRANPSIGEAKAGTIVEIRDVPRPLAEAHASKHPHVVEIMADAPAPEQVPPAIQQMVALAKAHPQDRKAAIIAMLGLMDTKERADLVAEITQMTEQTR